MVADVDIYQGGLLTDYRRGGRIPNKIGAGPYSGLVKRITDIDQGTGMETAPPLVNQDLVGALSLRGKTAIHH